MKNTYTVEFYKDGTDDIIVSLEYLDSFAIPKKGDSITFSDRCSNHTMSGTNPGGLLMVCGEVTGVWIHYTTYGSEIEERDAHLVTTVQIYVKNAQSLIET